MRHIGQRVLPAVLLASAVALAQPEPGQEDAGTPAAATPTRAATVEPSPSPKQEPAPAATAPAQPPPPAATAPEASSTAPSSTAPSSPPGATTGTAGTGPEASPGAATTPPPDRGPAPQALHDRARAFFAALLAGDPGPLVSQAQLPFFLEDRRIGSAESLRTEWLNQLRSKRTDLLRLQGFEALTPDEMERRFGKPPARLSAWPIRSGRTYLVVANLSGRAAVALYREVDGEWRVVAYHD